MSLRACVHVRARAVVVVVWGVWGVCGVWGQELAAETVVAQRLTEMYARTLVAKGWSLEQLARACKDRIEERSVKID